MPYNTSRRPARTASNISNISAETIGSTDDDVDFTRKPDVRKKQDHSISDDEGDAVIRERTITRSNSRRKQESSHTSRHRSADEGIEHSIHSIPQEALVKYKNIAFMKVSGAYTRLKAEHAELRSAYNKITLAYADLVSRKDDASAPKASTSNHLSKEDYPNIKFWTQRDFTVYMNAKKEKRSVLAPHQRSNLRGNARLVENNENVSNEYMETEDGESVDGATAEAMRKFARLLLMDMQKGHLGMSLPPTWKDVDSKETRYFLGELYLEYPYMRLCMANWKGLFLAARTLASMRGTQKKREKRLTIKLEAEVKIEPKVVEQSESSPSVNSEPSTSTGTIGTAVTAVKRKAATISAPTPLKKAKTGLPSPPTSSLPTSESSPVPSTLSAAPSSNGDQLMRKSAKRKQKARESSPIELSPAPESSPAPQLAPQLSPAPEPLLAPVDKAPEQLPESTMAEESRETSSAAETIEGVQQVPLVNPLVAVFGAPSGPSTRLDNFRDLETSKKAAFGPGMKRVTNSASAKNLFYIAYLKTNNPITPATFEKMWKELSRSEREKWNTESKENKAGA